MVGRSITRRDPAHTEPDGVGTETLRIVYKKRDAVSIRTKVSMPAGKLRQRYAGWSFADGLLTIMAFRFAPKPAGPTPYLSVHLTIIPAPGRLKSPLN
jgi:hypothetical protein